MNLRDALSLTSRDVVSVVGGGGKTTILYRLARETVAVGGRAIVTGTTRFTPSASSGQPPHVFAQSRDDLLQALQMALATAPLVVAGTGWGNKGRIMPVEPDWLADMRDLPDVMTVVAEADGSAGRPFKAPADHEPVIAAATTLVLTVVGIDVLGKSLTAERVHRPELVSGLSGTQIGEPVGEETIARVLLHERGGRKGVPPHARWLPVINKVESAGQLASSKRIAVRLLDGGAGRVIIAHAARTVPIVAVVE